MARNQLQNARDELERAAETAGDEIRDDVRDAAAAFAEFATTDREPDHAVLDGHLNAIRQAHERADGETADHLDRALDHAEEYREGVSST